MTIATQLHRIAVPAAALAVAITPPANPMLLALAAVSGGLLLAHRCVADLRANGATALDGETVFRHYL